MPSIVSVGTRLLLFLPLMARNAKALSTADGCKKLRRFYVLRHGQTDSNASGILQGSSDVSRLTSKGREQASTIGAVALCPVATGARRIDSIYTSPLGRARETLDALRRSAPPSVLPPDGSETVLDDLREIDFYSWENRPKNEIVEEYPEEYAAWVAGDPDGLVVDGRRPLWETWDRAKDVWTEIRSSSTATKSTSANAQTREKSTMDEDDETATLLVCHGTLGQALLGAAFGLDATVFRRNDFPNCGMAEIAWHDDDEFALDWRWHYPIPTERGCLRRQLGISIEM